MKTTAELRERLRQRAENSPYPIIVDTKHVLDLLDDLDAAERREAALIDLLVRRLRCGACPMLAECDGDAKDCEGLLREWLDRTVGS